MAVRSASGEKSGLTDILDTLQLTEYYPKKLTPEIAAEKTFNLGDLHPKQEVCKNLTIWTSQCMNLISVNKKKF